MEKMINADLLGIANVLNQLRFAVPPYQRPYAWTDEQVNVLYKDIHEALKRGSDEYFLGTLVVADGGEENRLNIIDGQQRLVTISILISALRDYFAAKGQERAVDIERLYLADREIRSQETTAHIYLVPDDRDFFVQRIVKPPTLERDAIKASNQAQERIAAAHVRATAFVHELAQHERDPDTILLDLLDYIVQKAQIIFVRVGSEANAFVIFEVLNDRGLDLSVADLLKNFLFRQAGKARLAEAQASWNRMTTLVTDVAEEKDVKDFIRQAWIAKHGLTREKQLYAEIKKEVGTVSQAVAYAEHLAQTASVYAALRSPQADRWKDYNEPVSDAVELFELAGVAQIRPLLMAIIDRFSVKEVNLAFPMMVAWTVRFLICGSGGSGTLETGYSERARQVAVEDVKTAKELYEAMKSTLPDDPAFEAAFSKATVSKAGLAKYYLRELARQRDPKNNELVVSTDVNKVNLEHILPQKRSTGWTTIGEAVYPTLVKRLGNLTLLNSRLNSKAANGEYAEKMKFFEASEITLTSDLKSFQMWNEKTINERQQAMAKLALKAWPCKP